MIWDWDYAFRILPDLVDAFWLTILVTVIASAASLAGGLMLALLRRSRTRIVSLPTAVFIEFIRGTPPFVQLLFLYFTLPTLGIMASPLLIGIVALAIHYSTYTSEVYRAGIQSVPQGQWDAACSLNCSPFTTWRRVILPQMIPNIIPALGSYTILMFKDTPLLAIITVAEVLQRANHIASESYRYTEPLTIVGVLFFIVSYLSSILIRYWERRVSYAKQ